MELSKASRVLVQKARSATKSTAKKEWLYFPLSLLLSLGTIGGVSPCGCALLCTVGQKARLPVLAGCLFAIPFGSLCAPLAAFCPLYLFFVLRSKSKTGEAGFFVRLLLSFSLSALWGAFLALEGVDSLGRLLSLILATVSYPLFVYAFSGFFHKKRELHKTAFDISLLAFSFAFTLGAERLRLGETGIGLFVGCLFCLFAARTRGFGFGCGCGIVCGLAMGGPSTGALGVMGLTYGMLACELDGAALLLSFMLGVTGYFYLGGTELAFPAVLMLLCGCLLFAVAKKHIPLHRTLASEKRANEKNLSRYAAAFSSLSSLFYTVSDTTKKESITDLHKRISDTVDSHCRRCPGCELEQSELSNFFTSRLRRCGVAAYSEIPLHIKNRCPNIYAIARDINTLSCRRAMDAEAGLKELAEEYSAVSNLLTEAAKKQEATAVSDTAAAKKLKEKLLSAGIYSDGVTILGTRIKRVTVYGVRPGEIKCSPCEIAGCISSVTGTKMSLPELVLNDGYTLLKSETRPAIRVEYAKCSEAKNGETVCGDTLSVFENDEKYFYCLLSDGMGSGRDAALTSRLSSIMLEKLLTVGAEKENALRMLNKALLKNKNEVFATVDLLEIDRVYSEATLIKVGAAPTLLIRNGECIKLESKTPPAGIMQQVIAEKKRIRLEKGDLLVMLSDGVLQTGSTRYLLPRHNLPPFPDARALASQLLRDARLFCDPAEKNGVDDSGDDDDMSICVLRII